MGESENGPAYGDEIDLVKPGFISDYSPEFNWADTIGVTAIKHLNSDKPEERYKDDMFVVRSIVTVSYNLSRNLKIQILAVREHCIGQTSEIHA